MRRFALALVLVAPACHPDAPATPEPARAEPPAATPATPTEPSPTTATGPTADASVEAMNADAITCVLADRRVGQYLHAELPDRVPVKLHLAPSVVVAKTPEAAGAPVTLVDASAALVDVHDIVRAGTSATVKLSIAREGVTAEVECIRDGATWRVGKADVAEH